jgi:hypothetical protein
MAEQDFSSYDEFFTFYLQQHSQPGNRLLHACGSILGVAVFLWALLFSHHHWIAWLWLPIGYGFAWTGHFLIEGNKPATFGHPWWSFISDFRMLALILTGRLNRRLRQMAAHTTSSST